MKKIIRLVSVTLLLMTSTLLFANNYSDTLSGSSLVWPKIVFKADKTKLNNMTIKAAIDFVEKNNEKGSASLNSVGENINKFGNTIILKLKQLAGFDADYTLDPNQKISMSLYDMNGSGSWEPLCKNSVDITPSNNQYIVTVNLSSC